MSKVLFISYNGLTDPLGQSQILPYMIGLKQKGYDIHILSVEKRSSFEREFKTIDAICKQNGLHWHYNFYQKKPPVISTIRDYRRLYKKAEQIVKKESIDLVHCRSYLPALVGQKLKRALKVPFIFDMRGFWADERRDSGLWNVSNPIYSWIYSYFKRKEKQFIQESEAIVSLTKTGKDEILTWGLPLRENKITVIPCCADFDHFEYSRFTPNHKENTREQLGFAKDDLIINYIGSIGTWYMLDEMLDFFSIANKHNPKVKFLFITKESKDLIEKMAIEKDIPLESIRIVSATREEVPALLNASNCSIFFIKNYYSKKASSPTKQAEIMGMGLPLICNVGVGDVDRIVQDTNSGIQISEFSQQEYSAAVEKLNDLVNLDKNDIRHAAIQRFNLDDGIKRYQSIYSQILNN